LIAVQLQLFKCSTCCLLPSITAQLLSVASTYACAVHGPSREGAARLLIAVSLPTHHMDAFAAAVACFRIPAALPGRDGLSPVDHHSARVVCCHTAVTPLTDMHCCGCCCVCCCCRIPAALPGRTGVDREIFGMAGVPAGAKPGHPWGDGACCASVLSVAVRALSSHQLAMAASGCHQ
jgi:hypothetical protein